MSGLSRDRLTWMVYCQLGIWGYFLYGFGPTIPLLRDDLHVSHAVGGLHATVTASAAIVVGLVGDPLVRRFGRLWLLWGGITLLCLGTVGYCATRMLPVTLTSALVFGVGGALIVNMANATLMDHHEERGPAALSEANAVAGAAGIAAPLVVGLVVAVGVGWRAGLLVTLPLAAATALVFGRVRMPHAHDTAAHRRGRARLGRRFWITWVMLVCTVGVEFCLSLWASELLRRRDGMPAWAATAAWSILLVGLTVSRVFGGRLVLAHGLDWLLGRALVVLGLGFVAFWLATTPWLAVPALAVAGLGLGVQYPLTAGRAIAAAGGRSDLAAGRLSVAAGLAAGGAPFVLGALADRYGVHTAFLLVPLLVVVALLGLFASGPEPALAQSAVREQLG